jgi:hypothetical protein
MSPIITHEDELELANMEKELVSQIKKLAKTNSSKREKIKYQR